LGAVLGPLIAIAYLHYHPNDFRTIFFIAFLPGILAAFCTFLIKEKKRTPSTTQTFSIKKNFSFYKEASPMYMQFIALLLLFGLANSSDMFLLLRAHEVGISQSHVIFLYMLFNLMYALFAFPIGKLADNTNRMQMLLLGFFVFGITYFTFGFSSNKWVICMAFIGYGLYYACTQSVAKAILLQWVNDTQKAAAIGFYEGMNSFVLLLSNAIAGFIWYRFGSKVLFLGSSFLVAIVVMMMFYWKRKAMLTIKPHQ
jgi:MFS family permease